MPKVKLRLVAILSLSVLFFPVPAVLADIAIDLTPPACSTNHPDGNYQQGGAIINLLVTGDDSAPGVITGISSLVVTQNSGPTSLPSPASTPSAPPYNPLLTYTYSWNPTIGTYNFTITAKDKVNNTTTCNRVFVVNSSAQPWIKTTGGDVHSNTGINAAGGP